MPPRPDPGSPPTALDLLNQYLGQGGQTTKPDGWTEYDDRGNEYAWQGGKLVATGRNDPLQAAGRNAPRVTVAPSETRTGRYTEKYLLDIGGKKDPLTDIIWVGNQSYAMQDDKKYDEGVKARDDSSNLTPAQKASRGRAELEQGSTGGTTTGGGAPPPPAAGGATALVGPDGRTFAQIKGTDYKSQAERDWYLQHQSDQGMSTTGGGGGTTDTRPTYGVPNAYLTASDKPADYEGSTGFKFPQLDTASAGNVLAGQNPRLTDEKGRGFGYQGVREGPVTGWTWGGNPPPAINPYTHPFHANAGIAPSGDAARDNLDALALMDSTKVAEFWSTLGSAGNQYMASNLNTTPQAAAQYFNEHGKTLPKNLMEGGRRVTDATGRSLRGGPPQLRSWVPGTSGGGEDLADSLGLGDIPDDPLRRQQGNSSGGIVGMDKGGTVGTDPYADIVPGATQPRNVASTSTFNAGYMPDTGVQQIGAEFYGNDGYGVQGGTARNPYPEASGWKDPATGLVYGSPEWYAYLKMKYPPIHAYAGGGVVPGEQIMTSAATGQVTGTLGEPDPVTGQPRPEAIVPLTGPSAGMMPQMSGPPPIPAAYQTQQILQAFVDSLLSKSRPRGGQPKSYRPSPIGSTAPAYGAMR